jgi:hypothetical protein
MEALQVKGETVRLRWDRGNNRPVESTGGTEGSEGDPEEGVT